MARYVVAWWLREKCLWLIGICGFVLSGVAGFFVMISMVVHLGLGARDGSLSKAEMTVAEAEINHQMMILISIWLALGLMGFWHGWLLKGKGKLRYIFAVGAFYAELFFSLMFLSPLFERGARIFTTSYVEMINVRNAFLLSLGVSLLFLALLRPWAASVLAWSFRNLRPQR